MHSLFPDLVGPEKPRGKHYVQPRGYAHPPGTGPEGETCGTCKHMARNKWSKVYLKCDLARHLWTHGPGSDIRARSPACKAWEPHSLDP